MSKRQRVHEVSITKRRPLPPVPAAGSGRVHLGGRIVDSSRPRVTVYGLSGGSQAITRRCSVPGGSSRR
jgi:hypothetical protein